MKKNIAVIFGGRSAEHDVSIITAHLPIISSLLAAGEYEVWPVYIAKDGSWYCDQDMNDIEYFKQPDYEKELAKQKKVQLSFDGGLRIIWPGLRGRQVKIDVAFPAMHGTYGEDGSLMGLLRMANVPFVGCDLFASAVSMDKAFTKQVCEAEGLPVVPYVWFTKYQWEKHKQKLTDEVNKLKWPLFVKPVHLGSSIAITKIKKPEELDNAIEVAFHYDDKVLVEESVEDLIEVTLPIIGNEELELAGVERPLNKTEFFDFSEKYLSGGKKGGGVNSQYSEVPAKIGDELTAEVGRIGKEAYRVVGCSGIARVDFLIDSKRNQIYVNEINTLPGSLYHHNWKQMGKSGVELVSKLVELAQERHRSRKDTTYTFESDILSKTGIKKGAE